MCKTSKQSWPFCWGSELNGKQIPPEKKSQETDEASAARLDEYRRVAAWALSPETNDGMPSRADISSEGKSHLAARHGGESPGTDTSLDGEGPGSQIGPYKILKEIGEGGFGSVFEAEQLTPVHRHVALKVIKLGMDTREVIARFETERQVLAMMDHPHIAKVFDAGTSAKGRPYFVMELVPGEAITSYCDRHKLTITERLELFDQVCQAVQHAHAKGIVHRDLKPNNILITTHNSRAFAKVIDFGIAKATGDHLAGGTALTQQRMMGTPLYMSPEQAAGSADIDTRTDIYALGVILYELVAGTAPFESVLFRSTSLAEMQRIICEVVPTLPSARLMQHAITPSDVAEKRSIEPRRLRGAVRGEIDWIVMKAIEKDRQRRYPTADALSLDIQKYLTGQPVTAAPPSKLYRLRKWTTRNKGAIAAATLIALSLLGGMLSFAWQARIADLRAAELEQVAKFQAEMLSQVNPAAAGELLKNDMIAMFKESMAKSAAPEAERVAAEAAFALQWQHVNATDVARNFIDRTMLEPAVAAIDEQFKDQPIIDATLRQVLADRYSDMGLFDAALPLQKAALATRRRVLGEDHPSTLESLGNMGEQLRNQGRFSEAEPYSRGSMEKRRRVLGEDHPDTLTAINNLAVLLLAAGKLNEAEPLYREALQKRRRVLGEDHPLTLNSAHNLGFLLLRQGMLSEAEPILRDVLEKRRRVLGDEHSDTLRSINTVGGVLREQGKASEAEPYFREALELRRRALGEDHPYTVNSIDNLGNLLASQGKLAEAEEYVRAGLERRRSGLGDDHPNTLSSLQNLGNVLLLQGKLSESEPYLLEAWERSGRVLGEAHPTTLGAVNSLGALRIAQNRFAEARNLLSPAESKTREVFTGTNTFRIAKLLMNLGSAHAGLGDRKTAEALLIEAQSIFALNSGPLPKDRGDCLQALIALYTAWHVAEPNQSYDTEASKWRKVLEDFNLATGDDNV